MTRQFVKIRLDRIVAVLQIGSGHRFVSLEGCMSKSMWANYEHGLDFIK
jgi:hypothetical protein